MLSVSAVILTYNRKDLLSRCLDAIKTQTSSPKRIIVVDNGSTDGTTEWVSERFGESVELYRLPQNRGSSGGFNIAMRIGYAQGDDLIWLMDDDVVPAPDALERLMAADAFLHDHDIEAPFVVSTAWTPEGQLTNVPEIDLATCNDLAYQTWPAFLEHSLVPVRRATFVSILLKRDTLKRHGLPIAQMYMWIEDTEFTMRVTRDERGYLVGDSHVLHIRAAPGVLDIRTEHDPARIGWHYFFQRNHVYNARRFRGHKGGARQFLSGMKLGLKLLGCGEARKAGIVLSGTWAGLFFNPKIEGADVAVDLAGLRYQEIKSAAPPKGRAGASSRPSRRS
jgi:GT2 family glycosyltransferase